MALSHPKPDLGTVCQSRLKKRVQKVGFSCRLVFFCLISVSFFATCQIHAGFMALPWHFLHPDFCVFSWKQNPNQTTEAILKNDHLAWLSDSSHIPRGFMALSWQLPRYVGFIADSWHFHGTFYRFKKTYCHAQVNHIHVSFQGRFMALSTKQSSKTVSCHLHGIFMALSPKNYFKIVIIVLSCLCLSFCRQRFCLLILCSLMFFQVNQFFGIFFFDQNIGL